MGLILLKYVALVAAIVAVVSIPVELASAPVNDPVTNSTLQSDDIYMFGSQTFYHEVDKPGNEFLKKGVEGYSQNLVPTEDENNNFGTSWEQGVSAFKSGYNQCLDAYISLPSVPDMTSDSQKEKVLKQFRSGTTEIRMAEDYFIAAKSQASPATSAGFTIGMVLPKVEQVRQYSQDAETAATRAVLADRTGDRQGFSASLDDTGTAIKNMRQIYPQLQVLSHDF